MISTCVVCRIIRLWHTHIRIGRQIHEFPNLQTAHQKLKEMVIMSTMNESFRIFPNGNPVPSMLSESVPLVGGDSTTLSAPNKILESDNSYTFIFWNVNAALTPPQYTGTTPDPVQTVIFPAPDGDLTFDATAWYIIDGGPGEPRGFVYAFSLNKDAGLSNSPIGTITPASAYIGPNTFSTTTSPDPVVVTAPAVIVGYGRFNRWLPFLEPPVDDPPVNDPVLTVPANGAVVAIASYGIPVPDPCQGLRDIVEGWDCTGAPNLGDCEKELVRYSNELRACERQYGEKPGD